jgi:hypothetical protein
LLVTHPELYRHWVRCFALEFAAETSILCQDECFNVPTHTVSRANSIIINLIFVQQTFVLLIDNHVDSYFSNEIQLALLLRLFQR